MTHVSLVSNTQWCYYSVYMCVCVQHAVGGRYVLIAAILHNTTLGMVM